VTPIDTLLTWLSGAVVFGFALFLMGLAVLIVARRSAAVRFLDAFASTRAAHFLEQSLRLVAGLALVSFAGSMRHADLFRIFGWLLVVTSLGLLVTPWRWHQRFARQVMPPLIRHLWLFASGAAALGVFLLYGLSGAIA
jgi:hypothetical protein